MFDAIKVHELARHEDHMSKRDQIDFIACVPRTLFDKGPNWKYDDWVKHMLEKGPHIDALTELPRLSFFTGKEKLVDHKKGEFSDQDTVVMASYPRCGNTLLRSLLEKVMGICTGSDNDITLGLVSALMDAGFEGEGIVDKRVMVVKTHYPCSDGFKPYEAQRSILLIRSPLDSLVSYFNLETAGSHSKTLDKDNYSNYNDVF